MQFEFTQNCGTRQRGGGCPASCKVERRRAAGWLTEGTCLLRNSRSRWAAAAEEGRPGQGKVRPTNFSTPYAPHLPHQITPCLLLSRCDWCTRPTKAPLHGIARKVRKDAFVRARALHLLHRHPPSARATGSWPPGASVRRGVRGFFKRILGRSAPRSRPTDAAFANLDNAARASRAAATTDSALSALACLRAASFADLSAAAFPAQSRSASGPKAATDARDR